MKTLTLVLSAAAASLIVVPQARAETNEADGVTIYWGAPSVTLGEHYVLPPDAPEWLTATFKDGGHFVTNIPAWYVPADLADDEEPACLYLMLDREVLGQSDLLLEVELLSSSSASLFVDLAGVDYEIVATNVVGDLALDHDELIRVVAELPVADRENASFIRLRHCGKADVTVTETTLLRIPIEANVDETIVASADGTAGLSSDSGDETAVSATSEATGSSLGPLALASTNATNALTIAPGESVTDPQRLSARVIHVHRAGGRDFFSGTRSAVVLEWTENARRLGITESNRAWTNAPGAAAGPFGTAVSPGGYVPSDGPKRSIRAGLDAARPGGTVVVHSGVYRESVRLIGKDVKVRIEGRVVVRDGHDDPPGDRWTFEEGSAVEPATNRLGGVSETTSSVREEL